MKIGTLYIKAKEVGDFKLYVFRSDVDMGNRYDTHYLYEKDGLNTRKSTFAIKLQTLNTIQPVGVTGIKQVTYYPSTSSTESIVNTDNDGIISNDKLEIIKDQDTIAEITNALEQDSIISSTDENSTVDEEQIEIQQEQNQNTEIEPQDSIIDSTNENNTTNQIENKTQQIESEDVQDQKQYNEAKESTNNNQILIFIGLGILIMLIVLFIKR